MRYLGLMNPDLAQKLFIAFASALTALFLKAVYDEVKESLQRKAFRKSLEQYIRDVLIPKTERLIVDYETVRRVIMSPDRAQLEVNQKLQTDWMPMLNSDILKRLPPQEVYRCLSDKDKYGLLFEAFYAIDWHREKMPQMILRSFFQKNLEHFENSNDREAKEEYLDHLFNCTYARALRAGLDNEINLRVGSARELLGELKRLRNL